MRRSLPGSISVGGAHGGGALPYVGLPNLRQPCWQIFQRFSSAISQEWFRLGLLPGHVQHLPRVGAWRVRSKPVYLEERRRIRH